MYSHNILCHVLGMNWFIGSCGTMNSDDYEKFLQNTACYLSVCLWTETTWGTLQQRSVVYRVGLITALLD